MQGRGSTLKVQEDKRYRGTACFLEVSRVAGACLERDFNHQQEPYPGTDTPSSFLLAKLYSRHASATR
jgi:hypothetical protein